MSHCEFKVFHVRKCVYVKSWCLRVNAYVLPGTNSIRKKLKEAFLTKEETLRAKELYVLTFMLRKTSQSWRLVKVATQTITNTARRFRLHKPNFYNSSRCRDPDDPECWKQVKCWCCSRKHYSLRSFVVNGWSNRYVLKSASFEVTYADDNKLFLYYNFNKPANKMLAPRSTGKLFRNSSPTTYIQKCGTIIANLRAGNVITRADRSNTPPEINNVHNYQ